ncbi:type IV pilus secretin PilQ [Candidatus Magnetominusculus dajiuhuensis]|uniref:type IV pilus secretin PilQ n=1 Tax=Candidatus Magnetominusculus dajiuhuensis TaxID=3137712 RepID=UPI003B433358
MIKRRNMLALFLLAVLLVSGCVSTNTTLGDEPIRAVSDNVLTDVSVDDYSLKITATGNFEYSFSRTSDPFKVFIELKGVSQGLFTERIIPKKDGISEIAFINKTVPVKATLIELTLTAPLDVAHSLNGNVLAINVKRLDDILSSPQPAQSHHDADVFVMPETETAENTPAPFNPDARGITGLTFKKEDGAVNLVIQGDGAMKPNFSKLRETLLVDIPGVRLSAVMPTDLLPPVKELKSEERPSGIRIIMKLDKDASSKVLTVGDTVIVSLTTTEMAAAAAKKMSDIDAKHKSAIAEGKKADRKAPAQGKLSPPPDGGTQPLPVASSTDNAAEAKAPDAGVTGVLCGKPVPCGTNNKLLSLDFQSAGIVSVFKVLAEESGCNIVVDPTVQGQITMQVKDAPWFQIVDLILKIHSLGCDITGNIIRIAPTKKLDEERDADLKRVKTDMGIKDTQEQMEPLVTKIFRISYATVDEMKALLTSTPSATQTSTPAPGSNPQATPPPSGTSSGLLSPRGTMTIDKRTSSIIVVDIPRVMDNIERMIKQLDKPPQQVLIEARIVEVSKSVNDTLGINWGILSYNKSAASSGQTSGLGVGGTFGSLAGNSYLGTLPSILSTAGTDGIVLGFMNAAKTAGLDLKLQALEDTSQGKVLTNPRLLTLNLQKASINQGQSIPYPQMNAQGEISAAFKDVTIKIDVTPQITPDNSVILQVDISKEDFLQSVTIGGSSAPQTTKLAEQTKVLIKDGETLVLGGVFATKESKGDEGLPFLKDIPVLGWLFKTNTYALQTNEYLIFITPRIVNREADEPS